ncbi:MAG TPA: D-aminoacylase [Candidatus Limnocylindria bacterium]|nr:D-aminoacylase [Candidatus Limnocylindria bacterium]
MSALLLRGGEVVDGTGAPARRADVGIRDGRVAAIGTDLAADGARVLDVRGLTVTPGFIDIHSHSDEAVLANPALESTLRQGVTTVVAGNCGGSSAPVMGLAAEELDREVARFGVERTWTSFGEYVATVERGGMSINFTSLVGHGTLRQSVIGGGADAPAAGELAAMKAVLASALRDGALGLSTGLIYPPSAYGTTDEIVALARVVADAGGVYASHIRNEGDRLLEAVEEGIEIGRRAGVRVQLSHHKASGPKNWGRVRDSTERIEAAQREGVDVIADQYPYTASSTGLAVTIPNWVHEGGSLALTERLRDPGVRARIRDEYVETGRSWDRIVIALARHRPEWTGRSVAALAAEAGRDPLEWTCDALVLHEGDVQIVHHSMNEDDVRHVMRRPWTCVGSDSRACATYGVLHQGKPHPRAYGTFPRVLGHYARDEGVLGFEDAVRKMTSLTASRLRLRDRGVLREGAWADLAIVDRARVRDTATFDEPHRYPEGIPHVIVNGEVALHDGETAPGRHGRFLRLGVDAG